MKTLQALCLVVLSAGHAGATVVTRFHQNANASHLSSLFSGSPNPVEQVWFNDLDNISAITVAVAGNLTGYAAQSITVSLFDSCAAPGSAPLAQVTDTFTVTGLTSPESWKYVTLTFPAPIHVDYGKYYYFTAWTNIASLEVNQNRYNHGRLWHTSDQLATNLNHPKKKKDLLFRIDGTVDDTKPPYPTPRTNVVCDEKCKVVGVEKGFPSTGSAVNVLLFERLRTASTELPGSFWDDYLADHEIRMLKADLMEMLEREPGLLQWPGVNETVPFSEIYDTMNFYVVLEDPMLDPGAQRGRHYCANIDVSAAVVRWGSPYTGAVGQFAGEVRRPGPMAAPTNNDSCSHPITYLPEEEHSTGQLGGAFFRDGNTAALANDYSSSCGGATAPDAVYKFRLREETRVKISTVGSDFDTVLSVRRSGPACPGSFEVACNDDSPTAGGRGSFIDVVLPEGEYTIIVDGAGTSSGRYTLQASGWGRAARLDFVHEVFGHGVSGLNDEYTYASSPLVASAINNKLNNPPIGCQRTPSPGPVVSGWCSDYMRIEALKDSFSASEAGQACWNLYANEGACRADSTNCTWIGSFTSLPGYEYFTAPSPGPTYNCIPKRIIYHDIGIDCDARPGAGTSGCFVGGYVDMSTNMFNVSDAGSITMFGDHHWGPVPPAGLVGFTPGLENLLRRLVGCVWHTSCAGYDYDACEAFIAAWGGAIPSNFSYLQFANSCERNGTSEIVTRR